MSLREKREGAVRHREDDHTKRRQELEECCHQPGSTGTLRNWKVKGGFSPRLRRQHSLTSELREYIFSVGSHKVGRNLL